MKAKYFLRGLGVGILVTTLLLFASAKKNNVSTLTDAEIMSRAKELGMLTAEEASDNRMDENLDSMKESLSASETPVSSPSSDSDSSDTSSSPEASSESPETPSPSPSDKVTDKAEVEEPSKKTETSSESKEKTITIKIESGMVSQSIAKYLYQKNVIGSAADFNNYMIERNVTQKILVGEYEIPTNASYDEIIDIIT